MKIALATARGVHAAYHISPYVRLVTSADLNARWALRWNAAFGQHPISGGAAACNLWWRLKPSISVAAAVQTSTPYRLGVLVIDKLAGI